MTDQADQPQTDHPILGAVAAAGESLKGVRDVQPVFMAADQKVTAVCEITALEAMLAELKLRVLAACGDAAEETGARDVSVSIWLCKRPDRNFRLPRAVVRGSAVRTG